jgi:cytidylate kinase
MARLPSPRRADIMDREADLVVVSGPPGAGKSTVARLLSKMSAPSALVAGDDFFGFIDRGFVAPWTAEAHRQNEIVVEAAAASAGRLAAGGYSVTYDGVIGPWLLERFGAATGLARLHYVVLLPPLHVCVERVGSRVGHGFTDLDATRHMYDDFAGARIDGRHVIPGLGSAELIATSIHEQVLAGSFAWTVGEDSSRPG